MAGRIDCDARLILLFHLLLLALATLAQAQAQKEEEEEEAPQFVWRADLQSPEELQRQGGFLSRASADSGRGLPKPNYSLYQHVQGTRTGMSFHDSAFVSTSKTEDAARQFFHIHLGGSSGYIYKIHVAPNMIDVKGTLKHFYSKSNEKEVSAVGRIDFTQIDGWFTFNQGVESKKYKVNQKYDKKFDRLTWAGAKPELAGFPKDHAAWKQKPWKDYATCEPLRKRMISGNCYPDEDTEVAVEAFLDRTMAQFPQAPPELDPTRQGEPEIDEKDQGKKSEPGSDSTAADENASVSKEAQKSDQGKNFKHEPKPADSSSSADETASSSKGKAVEQAYTHLNHELKSIKPGNSGWLKNTIAGLAVAFASVAFSAGTVSLTDAALVATELRLPSMMVSGLSDARANTFSESIAETTAKVNELLKKVTEEVLLEKQAKLQQLATSGGGQVALPARRSIRRKRSGRQKRDGGGRGGAAGYGKADVLRLIVERAVEDAFRQGLKKAREQMGVDA